MEEAAITTPQLGSADVMEHLNSPPDYQWRCPCIGMPCDAALFDRIQDLVAHMEAAHGLSIVLAGNADQ